ncbi:MAG: hypothetical protein PHC41_10910 [Lachnospiraceae bacterium]|nr:hypothetical protein [Lachnospiraceae bacterium]MDD3616718.1 hypothetical protein [Lachnospiraceae bacterium]
MSKDFENAVIPYTKEIPVDYKATVHSFFIGSYSPYEFTNWIDECMLWKTGCMIGDWSDIFKAELEGPDVLAFMQTISGIRINPFQVGQGKHVVCTNNRGKVIGEGIMLRLGEEKFRISGGPNFVNWVDFCLRQDEKWNATCRICSDDYFVYQVQGPRSLEILETIKGVELHDVSYMHSKDIEICNTCVQALRQGMSGNIGFELQGPSEAGVDIYNQILKIGEQFGGVTKVGNLAKGVNHVEACFPTATWDFTPALFDPEDEKTKKFCQELGPVAYFQMGALSRKPGGSAEAGAMDAVFSPVELGWGYSLTFDHDFPGSDILKEEKANPKRKICTLIWDDEDVKDVNDSLYREGNLYKQFVMPRDYEIAPDKVMKDGKLVGISMSRAYSVYFRKMISLCVLDVDLCVPDNGVTVIWGYKGQMQKEIKARVAQAPLFDPDKKRKL